MISLDNRLKTAAELCRIGKIAADVGCDHAQLACYLAENVSAAVIASDVRDGPLDAARKTVSEQGAGNVRIVKSDGLEKIDFADDVIICGMGGELIAEIIGGCKFTNPDTRFILQPMTKAEKLRTWLYKNGFEIIEERVSYDAGRAYSVMLAAFTGNSQDISEVFALTGKIADAMFLERIAAKLLKQADGMDKADALSGEAEHLRGIAAEIIKNSQKLK
ncbi:MAG: SAM-dependent methyltransferase [Oscillospiraceae bacterium]|nr:SAM-dependent methyltransferase [Oscillospiraceae bacterium]